MDGLNHYIVLGLETSLTSKGLRPELITYLGFTSTFRNFPDFKGIKTSPEPYVDLVALSLETSLTSKGLRLRLNIFGHELRSLETSLTSKGLRHMLRP